MLERIKPEDFKREDYGNLQDSIKEILKEEDYKELFFIGEADSDFIRAILSIIEETEGVKKEIENEDTGKTLYLIYSEDKDIISDSDILEVIPEGTFRFIELREPGLRDYILIS